jgi:hypothetical protein
MVLRILYDGIQQRQLTIQNNTFSTPSTEELFCFSVADTVNSVAPPPGRSFGFFKMFLATDIASCIKNSILEDNYITLNLLAFTCISCLGNEK